MSGLNRSVQQKFSVTVVVALLLISVFGITFVSMRGRGESVRSSTSFEESWLDQMNLPNGIHRDRFARNCLSCHSAALVFGQPRFSRKKWGEIVHKMNAVYGAPILKQHEPEIVEYLVSIQRPSRK